MIFSYPTLEEYKVTYADGTWYYITRDDNVRVNHFCVNFQKKCKSSLFSVFVCELRSLKTFLICSYFFINFTFVVLIKFVMIYEKMHCTAD